ncbi:MAG: alkyl sulfatase dimerization domain-containing protein, partial [Myxococcota bacterium]
AAAGLVLFRSLRPEEREVHEARALASPESLEEHCREAIGEPRIERVGERIFVAIGYDLANTILVRTDEGAVVIDAGMSPARSRVSRDALLEASPGPVAALVLTHSHIDHIGGAAAWTEVAGEDLPIWATKNLVEHFYKQYGVFRRAEAMRGGRQFGWHVSDAAMPCSALGRRIDLEAALEVGVRMPTNTFEGEAAFDVGGLTFELQEAHGETHDQLFVWIPTLGALAPGDNYYRTFPNLYTIRGTSPRPVDDWIESLDRMRRLAPRTLLPSHTAPLEGRERIAEQLTRYRDGIQWVRDQTVRAANRGEPVDRLAARVGLPGELAAEPALAELYGQLDWSARAIYTNELGWFDGRPETLYPVPPRERAERTVRMMGGHEAVLRAANEAREAGELRWSLELLAHLRELTLAPTPGDAPQDPERAPALREALEATLEALAAGIANTNGRGYLLESAHELRAGYERLPRPRPSAAVVDAIPLELLFEVMQSRLIPERADVHESVVFRFPDEPDAEGRPRQFVITVRRRVAEVVEGEPLPGTPDPVATLIADAATYRRIALKLIGPGEAIADGSVEVEGDALALATFFERFDRSL